MRWNSLLLELGGDRVEVRGLALAARRRFVELQTYLSEMVQAHPGLSLGYLYDHDGDFAWAITESLQLFGLSIERLTAGQVTQLLFAYDGGAGALWQLEFPEADEVPGRLLNPKTDPYHAAIAAIWSYTPDRTLEEVIESLSELSWSDVEGILTERNRIAIASNPELQAIEAKRKQQDALRKHLESIGDDDFFADFNPFTQQGPLNV